MNYCVIDRKKKIFNVIRRRFPEENRVGVRGVHPVLGRGVRLRHRDRGHGVVPPTAAGPRRLRLQPRAIVVRRRRVLRAVAGRAGRHVVRDGQAPGVPAGVATFPSRPPAARIVFYYS